VLAVADGATHQPISDTEAAQLFGLLAREPALVLAVSGGPDSTALLWLAARWRAGLEDPPKLVAFTVDHGLRPESAEEAIAVATLASSLNVEHRTLVWSGEKPRSGIQEAARNARYRLLSGAAQEMSILHLITAHTLDDQAETILFRMSRGSGVSGLRGMTHLDPRPVTGIGLLARPLLGIPKARLIATLDAAGIPFATDPSNIDPRFARPRWRQLMPALAEEGLTAERLARLAERVQRVEKALFQALNQTQLELCPGPWSDDGPISLDVGAFFDLPEEMGVRLLQRMVGWVGREGSAELGQFETLHNELLANGGPNWLYARTKPIRRTLAGALVTLTRDKLTVERAPPRRSAAKTGNRKRKAAFTKPR